MEWRGQFCGEGAPSARVIRLSEDWEKLWRQALFRPAPPADFSRHFAVAVFLGVQSTGGYDVEFLAPAEKSTELRVSYRIKSPAAGSFVIQAFTQPYAVRLYPKTKLDISVVEER